MTLRNVPNAPASKSVSHGARVFFFFFFALLITGGISMLFADLLWRRGWTMGATILICLFVPLMFLNAVGAMHGIYGFFIRLFGDSQKITTLKNFANQDISDASAAILFPIYNEDAAEVYARLEGTYRSLQKTGQLAHFDFHILSDSTDAAKWIDEESRWLELAKNLDALGRLFYRRRLWNEAKKSGNIRDFLNAHGNRYRYFIVFDADSFMPGKTIVDLVKLMEAHPRVGLIQTPPSAINSASLFGRMQQFANRLYAPLFTAGANYWVQGYGNYVGHNAISPAKSPSAGKSSATISSKPLSSSATTGKSGKPTTLRKPTKKHPKASSNTPNATAAGARATCNISWSCSRAAFAESADSISSSAFLVTSVAHSGCSFFSRSMPNIFSIAKPASPTSPSAPGHHS
jgi:membrane glycosyltransferase